MSRLPTPRNWGTFEVESFAEYRTRWPTKYSNIPDEVIETWIYRHWREFQSWLVLNPLDWKYEIVSMTSAEVLTIGHVRDWMNTLRFWGDDLLEGKHRESTWLGKFMLDQGTTPSPIIVAKDAGNWAHPREQGVTMFEPLQLVEGHLRLAYLQALIRRSHPTVQPTHKVVVAKLPANPDRGAQQ